HWWPLSPCSEIGGDTRQAGPRLDDTVRLHSSGRCRWCLMQPAETAPFVRACAHRPLKYPRKVRLIRKPALQCDLRERRFGRQHQSLGVFHSPPQDKGIGCNFKAALEGARELAGVEAHDLA